MLIRKQDDSVEQQDGKVVLFSLDRFLDEIAEGDGCFICGVKPGEREFNNEHVIPDWVLRDQRLHSRYLVLPNQAPLMYGRYVVPCCKQCNESMAEIFEEPISRAFAKGYEGVVDLIQKGHSNLLWCWLALIFLKVHLKHRELRWHPNRKQGDSKISETYDWTQLHHIHCVVRSFYTGAVVNPRVYGSLFVLPAFCRKGEDTFDFADLLPSASILLRIGPVFAFAVLNDSGFVFRSLRETIKKIDAPMTHIQGRELFARLSHYNLSLESRPRYHSEIDLWTEEYDMTAEIPEQVRLIPDPEPKQYGELMAFFVKEALQVTKQDPAILEYVREGRYTFLFGDDGKFLPQ